jgi:hypothetical protein
MRGAISADWAFGIRGAIENIVRSGFPSDLRSFPLLQAFDFESYHINEEYLIMVFRDKISGIPAGPGEPAPLPYSDYPSLPLTLKNVELWQAYLRNKFNLREEDAGIVIPLRDSGKGAPEDYALFSVEEQEIWNYQIRLTVARHKAHIERPTLNSPITPASITYYVNNQTNLPGSVAQIHNQGTQMSEEYINNFQGANIANVANTVKDNARQQAVQNVVVTEQKKTIAEAVSEVERLLRQLEETNPAATEPEQLAYVNIAAKPDLRQRAIAALKEGGETAIDEFVLENKYLKVVKAVIKGWLQPSG